MKVSQNTIGSNAHRTAQTFNMFLAVLNDDHQKFLTYHFYLDLFKIC